MKDYLAIDIGASSGRHIVGWREDGMLQIKEVYRFSNAVTVEDDHLTWDTKRLLAEVKQGIRAAQSEFGKIESLSIDTWGVDYVIMDSDQEILPCYAYRDSRTDATFPKYMKKLLFRRFTAAPAASFRASIPSTSFMMTCKRAD